MWSRGNKTVSFAGVAVFCFLMLNMVSLINISMKTQTKYQEKRYEKLRTFQEQKNMEVKNEVS